MTLKLVKVASVVPLLRAIIILEAKTAVNSPVKVPVEIIISPTGILPLNLIPPLDMEEFNILEHSILDIGINPEYVSKMIQYDKDGNVVDIKYSKEHHSFEDDGDWIG